MLSIDLLFGKEEEDVWGETMSAPTFSYMAPRYQRLWDNLRIKPGYDKMFDAAAENVLAGMPRYKEVFDITGVPPVWTGLTHKMEGNCNFRTHLHNGDPLSARTYHVPKGRPKAPPRSGHFPYTWEESAEDSLVFQGYDKVRDWTVLRFLYLWEAYNGWGYYYHGINSPYLWSFSNNYTAGRYVSDGVWSSTSVSKQIGTACLLKWMMAVDKNLELVPTSAPKADPVTLALMDGMVFNSASWENPDARCCDLVDIA